MHEPHEGHEAHGHGPATHEQKIIGLVISIIAIFLAVASTITNKAKTDEMLTRIAINDGWSFYQAKRVRRALTENSSDQLTLNRALLPAAQQAQVDVMLTRYASEIGKYKDEEADLKKEADRLEAEGKVLAKKIEVYEIGETLFHVSIVLCSITLLISQGWFFRGGIAVAAIATALIGYGYFGVH